MAWLKIGDYEINPAVILFTKVDKSKNLAEVEVHLSVPVDGKEVLRISYAQFREWKDQDNPPNPPRISLPKV